MCTIKFGVRLPIGVLAGYFPLYEKIDFGIIQDLAIECENLGYHSIWFNDHLIVGQAILECWTTLSALSTLTRKIRLGSLVLCNTFRYPSMLAKMAATLDFISGGRLEFGIGACWNDAEHKAYGLPFPKRLSTRVERLNEAVEIVKEMWTEQAASYEGKYYQINGAVCEPKPVQKPHPPITIGGEGELTLRVVAKHADRCNFSHRSLPSPHEYEEKLQILRNHCSKVGRNIDEIEKSWYGQVYISNDWQKLRKQLKLLFLSRERQVSFEEWLSEIKAIDVVGTPNECVEKLRKYVDIGVTYFLLRFGDAPSKEGLRLFAEEIIPNL